MAAASRGAVLAPVVPSRAVLRPLGLDEVRLMGGFWRAWQDLNAATILDHCEAWMERIGWIGNFDAAAAGGAFEHAGQFAFVDSEVYKLLEAMAWELGARPDAGLRSRFDALVARVAAAQEPDGYLHTAFGRPGQPARWSDLEQGHELYCAGHLIQAAVARLRSGHDDLLVEVARRVADLLVVEFGAAGRDAVCGHPEVEMALVEFGRATGRPAYVELARLFVERRGRGLLDPGERGAAYYLDDRPVRDADVLRGHAVRALYLAAGALDVADETGDAELAAAVERQWAATVARRTYLTGAMGSHHQDEAYGDDWELPADRAYGETCAGVASVMLSWRLLLRTGDDRYADLIERTLLNNVLASPREDGRAFFYSNTLHQRTRGQAVGDDELNPRAEAGLRAPWFEVSCCPTNVARTLASIAGYLATATDDGVQLHQYADAEIATPVAGGRLVLRVRTAYPDEGVVRIEVVEAPGAAVALRLRIPPFARGAATLDGEPIDAAASHVEVRRVLAPGTGLELRLPRRLRRIVPDPRIDAVRGSSAYEHGPDVLAVESVDLPGGLDVDDLVARGAVRLVDGIATAELAVRVRPDDGWPYPADDAAATVRPIGPIPLLPYRRWGNRGPSTMRVWIPDEEPA
ncbi:glycoside hydrolase family 127 protein [Pseudolysinimonas sp.]|uniref:glycoside hydrolase family 127 protein n=1 Tax=Pseudolysinimonas sp. TaxID=2680009 RepID=UPI003F7E58F2